MQFVLQRQKYHYLRSSDFYTELSPRSINLSRSINQKQQFKDESISSHIATDKYLRDCVHGQLIRR